MQKISILIFCVLVVISELILVSVYSLNNQLLVQSVILVFGLILGFWGKRYLLALFKRIDIHLGEDKNFRKDPFGYLEKIIKAHKKDLEELRTKNLSNLKFINSLNFLFRAETTNELIKELREIIKNYFKPQDLSLLLIFNQKNMAILYPICGEAVKEREEIFFERWQESLETINFKKSLLSEKENLNILERKFLDLGYQSSFTFPIKSGTLGLIGIFGFASKENIEEEVLTFLKLIFNLASLKLLNSKILEKLGEREEELAEFKQEQKEKIKSQIEELKNIYSQVVQAGKLASLGQLAAGVAHELNNPIGGILGYTQLILEKLKRPSWDQQTIDSCVKYLELMEKESKRCQWIISNLLNFARKPLDERKVLDIKEVIENTLSMMEYQLVKNNIKVELIFPPEGLKKIEGNSNELQQVFTNLIQNAQDAMPEGGKITIKGENKLDSRFSPPIEYIEITVSDTGCGIPPEHIHRIFEPFFTSKIGKSGTGLGLSITYAIITSHRGIIKVESQVGKGTSFIINLPIAKGV